MPVREAIDTSGYFSDGTAVRVIALSHSAQVGDFIVVTGYMAANGETIASIVDDAGNTYRLVTTSLDWDSQTGETDLPYPSSGRAFIAFTKVTNPGPSTVTVTWGVASWGVATSAIYSGMTGYEFSMADYYISNWTPLSPSVPSWWPDPNGEGPSSQGSTTGMITWGDSLVLSFGVTLTGVDFIPANTIPLVYMNHGDVIWFETDASFFGARSFSMSEFLPSSPGEDFIQSASAFNIPFVGSACVELCAAVFSKPLSTTKDYDQQHVLRGGKGPVGTIAAANTIVEAALPWLPDVGNLLVVTGTYGGGTVAVDLTPTDDYGNVYTQQLIDHSPLNPVGVTSSIWTCFLTAVPSSGPFIVRMTVSGAIPGIFAQQGPPVLSLREYNIQSTGTIITGGYADYIGGEIIAQTLAVADASFMIGVVSLVQNFEGGYAFTITPNNGFTSYDSWLTPLPSADVNNRARVGTGIVMDQNITVAGNYTAAADVPFNAGIAVIGIALPGMNAGCPVITSIALGIYYSSSVTASGGAPPYTFAVTSGSLPAGLTLDSSTGLISGIPTSVGSFSFTITVTDSIGTSVSVSCGIDVTATGACEPAPLPSYNPVLFITLLPSENQGS